MKTHKTAPRWALAALWLCFGVPSAWSALAASPTAQPSPDPAQAWADLQTKAALNGLVQASVSYKGQEVQVLVLSKKRFTQAAAQPRALQAARLIQRDVAVFCGSHCRALPMPAPQLMPNGQLRFSLRLTGLGRQLFQEELQALLSGSTGLPAAQPSPSPSPSPSSLPKPAKAKAQLRI